MKNIALIGSTGSIGKQTLSVVRRHKDKFKIVSLAAGQNVGEFLSQVKEFNPLVATLGVAQPLGEQFPKQTEFFFGENSFTNAIIDQADIVVVALVGFKGLIAVLDAIEKGKDVALANKESLVVGGELVMQKAKEKGVNIYPVDSEHSAVWQALGCDFNAPFNKIILTCSGGAFRDYDEQRLKTATAKDALAHPNWKMGAKITVDCATVVNKAFEVIEAKWLYNTSFDKIDVIVHRESIIHSMVEMADGAVLAQLSYPDMELPIQLALSYPDRLKTDVKSLDFSTLGKLTFEQLDRKRFPCFDLVVTAGKQGNGFPAVANGANEQAVELFLRGIIGVNDIYKGIYGAMLAFDGEHHLNVETLTQADAFGRRYVKELFGV